MDDVAGTVTELVAQEVLQDRGVVELNPATNLIEAGLIDSLAIVLLVELLQERFDIEIEPEDVVAENFGTIAAIADLVATKLAATSGSA